MRIKLATILLAAVCCNSYLAAGDSQATQVAPAANAHLGAPSFDVDLLDRTVHLSAEQKAQIASIYVDGEKELRSAHAAKDTARIAQLLTARRRAVQAILTPEQRQIFDATPEAKGGASRVDPRMTRVLENRMAKKLKLSDEQLAKLREIDARQAKIVANLGPEGHLSKEQADQMHLEVRAIMTPEQQAIFDAHPGMPPFGY